MKVTLVLKPKAEEMQWLMRLTLRNSNMRRITLVSHKLTQFTHQAQQGHPIALVRLYEWRVAIDELTDTAALEVERLHRLLESFTDNYLVKSQDAPSIKVPAGSETAVVFTQLLHTLDDLLLLINACRRVIYKRRRTFSVKNKRYLHRLRHLMETIVQTSLPPLDKIIKLSEKDRRTLTCALTADFKPIIRRNILQQLKQYQEEK